MNCKTSRSSRRHHIARLKAKWRARSGFALAGASSADARRRGMFANTRVACSCWMCGNPRKFFGERTQQERRDWQAKHDHLFELQ